MFCRQIPSNLVHMGALEKRNFRFKNSFESDIVFARTTQTHVLMLLLSFSDVPRHFFYFLGRTQYFYHCAFQMYLFYKMIMLVVINLIVLDRQCITQRTLENVYNIKFKLYINIKHFSRFIFFSKFVKISGEVVETP
jgi:hypothetical protein